MHGLIFTSFQNYLLSAHGKELAEQVLGAEPVYLVSETYPDEAFASLVSRAAGGTGWDEERIVHDFGAYAGEMTFPRLYPAYYEVAGDTRSFLLTVESHIHELVRATIPNATPPKLVVSPLGDDGVSIAYSSPRRLCLVLRGLAEGTARHFGEQIALDEHMCMRRGDDACHLDIRLSS